MQITVEIPAELASPLVAGQDLPAPPLRPWGSRRTASTA